MRQELAEEEASAQAQRATYTARIKSLESELGAAAHDRLEREREWLRYTQAMSKLGTLAGKLPSFEPQVEGAQTSSADSPPAAIAGAEANDVDRASGLANSAATSASTQAGAPSGDAAKASASQAPDRATAAAIAKRSHELFIALRSLLEVEQVSGFDLLEAGTLGRGAIGPVVMRVLDDRGHPIGSLCADRMRFEASRSARTLTIVLEDGFERRQGEKIPFEGPAKSDGRGARRDIVLPDVDPRPWVEACPELFARANDEAVLDDQRFDLDLLRASLNTLLRADATVGFWRVQGIGGVQGSLLRDVQLDGLDREGRLERKLFADRMQVLREAQGVQILLEGGAQLRGDRKTPFLDGRFRIFLPRAKVEEWSAAGTPGLCILARIACAEALNASGARATNRRAPLTSRAGACDNVSMASRERDGFFGADAEAIARGGAARIYTVGELTANIRGLLEGVGRVSVEGEVNGVRGAASGHLYFTLKDIDASIACAIWKSKVKSAASIELCDGQAVIVHGKLDVYAPRGSYTLVVERIEPRGLGALLVELERLKAELRGRGWFDRRRPLPKMPKIVGVVTSRDGAAFQDFLRTRSLRWPLYPVRLAHTPVQGANAAREIAAAIQRLDASGVDVIVVCRGGGSLQDLWAFNELAVAEAIWNAGVPVVSGIGHETDVTLADLVADHRAHTPTDAAQCVLPDRTACIEKLERAESHFAQAIDEVLARRAERLERAAGARVLRDAHAWIDVRGEALDRTARALRMARSNAFERTAARLDQTSLRLQRWTPIVRIERASARLVNLAPRMASAIGKPLQALERRIERAETSLAATSPDRVLARGYSITRRAGETAALVDASAVKAGERVETRLAQGWITSRVETAGETGA